MNILIGKPPHCSSSSTKVWQGNDKLYISKGHYSARGGNMNHIEFWSINNCILDIDIDISIGTPEYEVITDILKDDVDEIEVIKYTLSLILKYITPSQFLTCIENESSRQFRAGQRDKVEEIRSSVSKLGFDI